MSKMNKEVFITGASSYVGARLYKDIKAAHPETTGTYNGTKLSDDFVHLDVTNKGTVLDIVQKYQPKVIVHAAANASADWCEQNPELAINLNRDSTQHIVDAANIVGAQVYLISSFAAINPSNVYGRTKMDSEQIAKHTDAGYVILRPSLIMGMSPNTTNDRPHNRLLRNIEGKPAEYDTSWKFQPTYIGHLSSVILEAMARGIKNETIPVAVPDLKSRFDVARDILSEFNIPVKPLDKNMSPDALVSLDKLKELRLPEETYEGLIAKVVKEIKHKDSFLFQK